MRPLAAASLVCALASAAAPAAAAEWAPVAKLDLLGGQFFFQGDNTSFSGNANWLFSPGIKLDSRNALIPIFNGEYRRTREVRELIGGGFLTQETLDTSVALKWVHLLSEDWNVKPVASYRNELVTESTDEKLGDGLYDYHKVSLGAELERTGGALLPSVRHALSVYGVRFYHYRALSASSADLGAEINAGDRVLDFNAYDYSLAADMIPWDGGLLSGSMLASYRPYRDQKIVTLSGEYRKTNRVDVNVAAALSGRQNLPALNGLESVAGLNASLTRVFSNQNNYDATNTRFNPAYYDYGELSLGPFFAARWRKKMTASLSYDYSRRNYDHRPAQDEAGLYTMRAIRMDTHTVAVALSYPLPKGFSLKTQGSYRRATSNMLYEGAYRYNYYTAYYFAGVGWEL